MKLVKPDSYTVTCPGCAFQQDATGKSHECVKCHASILVDAGQLTEEERKIVMESD